MGLYTTSLTLLTPPLKSIMWQIMLHMYMLTVNCRCQADLAIQAMSQDHSFIDWVFALAGSFTKDPNIEHHGADFVDISLGIIVRNTADPILAFPKIYKAFQASSAWAGYK